MGVRLHDSAPVTTRLGRRALRALTRIDGAVLAGFLFMFVRSVQVSVANWRRGYSVLERPEAFDAAPT